MFWTLILIATAMAFGLIGFLGGCALKAGAHRDVYAHGYSDGFDDGVAKVHEEANAFAAAVTGRPS
jgi:hypothetical protein